MSTASNVWLASATKELEQAGISTARLDCLVLLEDAVGKDRAWLLSHPEYELQGSVLEILSTKVAQIAKHIPLAYIRGKAEFYGRDFLVNEHTLVPRPETETMIDVLKTLMPEVPPPALGGRIVLMDVGTGSGAIAITAKLEIPDAIVVVATDIDQNCLAIAKRNAQMLSANITLLPGNLLQPLIESRNIEGLNSRADTSDIVLLCNLPYVPDDFHINTAATHEPRHAIFGGSDGLDLYRQLFEQIKTNTRRPGYILTESLPPQHQALANMAKASGYSLQKTEDFIQLFGPSS